VPLPFPQDQVGWLLTNRGKISRYAFLPQLLVAVVLSGFAYSTGKTDMHLLLKGARTQGKIVGFQKRLFSANRNRISTGTPGYNIYLPVVEFEAEGVLARFEEHKLVPAGEGVGWSVPVLYDPANPSVAMIDRSNWNWLPWGPALAIALVVGLASVKGLFVFLFVAPRSPATTGV
jgi:hypothetical protein